MSAELNDDAFRFFLLIDIEHVLEREWLEVKFVAGVVIGRNRFRVRIDHDRFKSELAQCEGGVHATVIKFNPLADPVRSAAENHHLAFATLAPLVLVAVSRVIIRRVSFELRRAGINQAISRQDRQLFSRGPHPGRLQRIGVAKLVVGKAKFFCPQKFIAISKDIGRNLVGRERYRPWFSHHANAVTDGSGLLDLLLCHHNLLKISEKPLVDLG